MRYWILLLAILFSVGCVDIPEMPVIPTMPPMEIPTIATTVPTPVPTLPPTIVTTPPTAVPTVAETTAPTILETPTTVPILETQTISATAEPTTKPTEPIPTNDTPREPKTLSVAFLDVGQGDSILITYNGTATLIDAGKTDYGVTVVEDLRTFGVTHLTYAIMTHEHEDHFGGFQEVFQSYSPDIFVYTSCGTTTCTKRVLGPLGNSAEMIQPRAGTPLYLDPDVKMRVVSPPQGGFSDINDGSIVVLLTYYDSSFLFMGDAEQGAEEYMMDTYDNRDLDIDILKVGHHGSEGSLIQEFLDMTTPQVAVISVGEGNSYGHPDETTIDLLKENNINTLRTDTDGTIVISTDGTDMSYLTYP